VVAAVTIEPGDSAQNPARTPSRTPLVARSPAARPPSRAVYSFVTSINSFVMGWPNFSALPHYPILSLPGYYALRGFCSTPSPTWVCEGARIVGSERMVVLRSACGG
jgi:hypothetical protein